MPEDKYCFRVKVNDFDFTFCQEDIDAADLVKISASEFHLIKDNKSITVSMLEADDTAKLQVMQIAGEKFSVKIKDEVDDLIDNMGYSVDNGKHIKEIKAPMPGLVLQVHVTEGQHVKEGDKLLVLVAMKMENSILIHTDTTIKQVAVMAGQAVEKGQLLVELE